LSLARPMRIVPLLLLPSLIFALLFHLPPIQHWAGQHLSPGIVYNLTIFDRLWTMFALGTAALVVWPYLRLSWSVAIAGVVVLALSVQCFPIPHLVSLVTGYCVLCAGFLTGSGSARWP